MSNNGKKHAIAVAGAKKGPKQGNLFSFFSKKEKQPKCTESKQQSVQLQPQNSTVLSDSNQAMLSKPINQGNDHRPVPLNSSSDEIHSNTVRIGDCIEVFWADDEEWYQAKVLKQKSSTSTYFIQYSIDGQSEWIDLSTESFHLITDNTRESQKRRNLTFDNYKGDCSDENEYVPSSSDDEAESAFNEDDQWMVTDDEDEVVPKKKQKINLTVAAPATNRKAQRKQNRAVKESSSDIPSLAQYVAPVTMTQYSFEGRDKTTPISTQTALKTLTTPQHITPMTTASGSTFSSSTLQNPCNDNIATPLAPTKSFIKPQKRNESPQAPNFEVGALNPAGSHVHNHLPFLQNPRDSHGRTSEDPNYDPRTIQIQEREWIRIVGKKMTDAVKQWWDLKAMYFDTVLLFKTGKLRYFVPQFDV